MARKVNEDLNLTPFIDLFSTLVVFLLLTAVWNQLNSLSTNIENSTSSDSTPPPKKEVQLGITVFQDKVQILEDNKPINIPNTAKGEMDMTNIVKYIQYLHQKYPTKKNITLNTANTIPYGHMIQIFDTLVGEDFPDVGVNTQ